MKKIEMIGRGEEDPRSQTRLPQPKGHEGGV